ncbi:MAG: aspartate carbamoyltransferase regulatory subunit, partial [Rikenellaceae bacterium]|nr:aspartate carbamoyltransferase regulatory subunit [Rikenellaceae bacterium]
MAHENTVMEVSALENGTVIDHIPADSLFKIINILSLDKITNRITFGTNLESKRIGIKAIIKVADMEVDRNYLSRIALFAPEARLSYIKNFEVAQKIKLVVPDTI